MIEQYRQAIEKPFLFIANSGPKLDELKRGYARLIMPMEGNGNHINTMYAGALFTLAEVSGGALAFSCFDMKAYYPIVKDMQIRYTAPGLTDIAVEARLSEEQLDDIVATTDEKGKADYVLDVELKNTDGEIVAITTAIYQLRKINFKK